MIVGEAQAAADGGGVLTISDGASMLNDDMIVANVAGSRGNVIVDGDGAALTNSSSGWTTLGQYGSASIIVTNGGRMIVNYAGAATGVSIARYAGSTGVVDVVGTGSRFELNSAHVYGHLAVGGDWPTQTPGGHATVRIRDGGVVYTDQTIYVFDEGKVQLDGGTVNADTLSLYGTNAQLSGRGTIVGDVNTQTNGVVNSGASVIVGNEFGIVTNTGSWDNRGITLTLGIADVFHDDFLPGENYDALDISGNWRHGGTIQLDLSSHVGAYGSASTTTNLRMIAWNSATGASGDTTVNIVNIPAGVPTPGWSLETDGFYVEMPVPARGTLILIQ